MTTFYMVTVDGMGAPTHRYEDRDKAKTEAQRLCQKEGRPVHLMMSLETVTPPPGVWTPTQPKADV